jgi:hypothetical protein
MVLGGHHPVDFDSKSNSFFYKSENPTPRLLPLSPAGSGRRATAAPEDVAGETQGLARFEAEVEDYQLFFEGDQIIGSH